MDRQTVSFRPVTQADAERLYGWRNHEEVRRYMYHDQPFSREDHARWMDSLGHMPSRRDRMVLYNGEPVGLASFYDLRARPHPLAHSAAWAYYLAGPDVRGRGVGACVEYLMIEEAFGPLGLEKLWCEVLVSNEAVWKLHQAFGFVTEAHLRQHVIRSDGPQDVYGLGLLRTDWLARREDSRLRLEHKGFAV